VSGVDEVGISSVEKPFNIIALSDPTRYKTQASEVIRQYEISTPTYLDLEGTGEPRAMILPENNMCQ